MDVPQLSRSSWPRSTSGSRPPISTTVPLASRGDAPPKQEGRNADRSPRRDLAGERAVLGHPRQAPRAEGIVLERAGKAAELHVRSAATPTLTAADEALTAAYRSGCPSDLQPQHCDPAATRDLRAAPPLSAQDHAAKLHVAPAQSASAACVATHVRITMVEVRAARDGDGAALERILRALRPVLLRYATRRVRRAGGSTDLAEDVVQDALVRVASCVSRCTAETPGRLFAWALAITRREVLELHRTPPLELSTARAPLDVVDAQRHVAARWNISEHDAKYPAPHPAPHLGETDMLREPPMPRLATAPTTDRYPHERSDVEDGDLGCRHVGHLVRNGVRAVSDDWEGCVSDPTTGDTTDRAFEHADASATAYNALARLGALVMTHLGALPDEIRDLVWAHVVDGRAWSVIAAEHASTPSAVKRRYQRAQARVRRGVLADIATLPAEERERLLARTASADRPGRRPVLAPPPPPPTAGGRVAKPGALARVSHSRHTD